jgi:hypothetical protein
MADFWWNFAQWPEFLRAFLMRALMRALDCGTAHVGLAPIYLIIFY